MISLNFSECNMEVSRKIDNYNDHRRTRVDWGGLAMAKSILLLEHMKNGTTNAINGTTDADAGVGIGMERGIRNLAKKSH